MENHSVINLADNSATFALMQQLGFNTNVYNK